MDSRFRGNDEGGLGHRPREGRRLEADRPTIRHSPGRAGGMTKGPGTLTPGMTGEACDDGPRGAVAAPPLVIPAKAGIQGGKGRAFGVRPEPTSQALRPHGNRNRDTNMDSRFRGNDGRGGVSASSRWPPSDRRHSPLRHSRESGNPGQERTGPWAYLGPSSQPPRPHGSRNRNTNMDSRFRGNDGRGGCIRLEPMASLGPSSQPPPSFPRKSV